MIEVIFWGSIFCSLITAYLLFLKTNVYQKYSSRLLGFSFIFYSWCAVVFLLIKTGWIISTPYLFKTAAPIDLITPPLAYLYVRSVLKNELRFKNIDLWHFLPALIFAVNYLPIYLMSDSEKLKLVTSITLDNTINYNSKLGILPESIHSIVRLTQISTYIILQWILLFQFNSANINDKFKNHTRKVLIWLKLFTTSHSFILISLLTGFGIFIINRNLLSTTLILDFTTTIVALGYLALSTYLLLTPEVLFGFPYRDKKTTPINSHFTKKQTDLKSNNFDNTIYLIQEYFNCERPYLKKMLSINEVAIALDIPARDLSFILNQHFNQRFTDYVNSHRINYVIEKIEEGFCDKYTLETLASQAGFSSRSTFHMAFKKATKLSPSKFIASKTQNK